MIQKTDLPNGLTIVSDYMPGASSAVVGAWIPRGSRHETKGFYGLSHFYEHLVFKGTENRSAFEIACSIEDKGGSLEAYTTRQETGFYASVVKEDIPLAVEVIADMLMNPLLDKTDMEKERKVIIEEILSYEDIPEECAMDLFNEIHFKDSGLAHPITGSVRDVKMLTYDHMNIYSYDVKNTMSIYICAAGKVDHQELVQLCEKHFEKKKCKRENGEIVNPKDEYKAHAKIKEKQKQDIQQASVYLGTSFLKSDMPKDFRYSLSAFNIALGAGMASHLFQKIREELGLAYSIYSSVDVYKDCFGFNISFGASPQNIKKAFDVSLQEMNEFIANGFEKDELERTKNNILGSMRIGSDNPEKRALRLAEQILHLGEVSSIEDVEKKIKSLTRESILGDIQLAFKNPKYAAAVITVEGAKKLELTF